MKIYVCKRSEIEKFSDSIGASHILSMSDPQKKYSKEISGAKNINKMYFEDEEDPNSKWAPTRDDVQSILMWGRSLPEDSIVVVSCDGGVCRSPAAALMLIVQNKGSSLADINDAVEELLLVSKYNCPNKLMMTYADEMLNCKGELVNISENLAREHMKRYLLN